MFHIVDDFKCTLQKEAKHNSKAENLETPEIVDRSEIDHLP